MKRRRASGILAGTMLGRRLVAGSSACLFGVLCATASVAADVSDSLAQFVAVRAEIAGTVSDRFGTAWRKDMFNDAVAAELVWLDAANGELKDQHDALVERRSAERSDRDLLQPKIDANAQLVTNLQSRRSNLSDRERALLTAAADLRARVDRHNANRCRTTTDNPGACAAYDAEKRSLDAEHQDLVQRIASLQSEDDDLSGQETAAQQDAAELASQDRALDQREDVLKDDEDAFVRRCDEATTRARALLEVLRNPRQDALSSRAAQRAAERDAHMRETDEMGATFATSVGSGAMGGLVKGLALQVGRRATLAETLALAGSRAVAGSAAIALPAADILAKDMDERSSEVANNTYLLGAYGAALVNLKREGRLRPGDKGYDALRSMSASLGGESPGSGAEFTLQSLALTKHTIRNAIVGLAVELTPTPGERVADGLVESIVTKRIAKSGTKMAAVSVGHGVAEEYVKTLQHDYFMKQPLKWISDSVDGTSRQAAQDALRNDAK
ncbi:MAG TPA: hypothetical protein VK665_14275 [Candidatus Elarobacter sp.]|nr:hypothetical protein [Candidatus Elarobacter sp.]